MRAGRHRQPTATRSPRAVALGRIGQPEDVAAVASFLLSDDSAFVTGSDYRVDGGMTMA